MIDTMNQDVAAMKASVREKYGQAAQRVTNDQTSASCCGSSACCGSTTEAWDHGAREELLDGFAAVR